MADPHRKFLSNVLTCINFPAQFLYSNLLRTLCQTTLRLIIPPGSTTEATPACCRLICLRSAEVRIGCSSHPTQAEGADFCAVATRKPLCPEIADGGLIVPLVVFDLFLERIRKTQTWRRRKIRLILLCMAVQIAQDTGAISSFQVERRNLISCLGLRRM